MLAVKFQIQKEKLTDHLASCEIMVSHIALLLLSALLENLHLKSDTIYNVLLHLPKSSMPLAALLCAWSPTFADSFIAMAVKIETLTCLYMDTFLTTLTDTFLIKTKQMSTCR